MDIKYHAFYIFKIFLTDIHVAMYRLVAATPNRRASKFPVEAILAALPKRASDNDARLVCRTHATCCSIVRPKGKTIDYNNLRRISAKPIKFHKNIANLTRNMDISNAETRCPAVEVAFDTHYLQKEVKL